MKIESILQANRLLESRIPDALTGRVYKLKRMREIMRFLGNPQNKLRIIHVAGTSGKTSTAYYASALLSARGYNVGLTVSPHMNEVNERLQINQLPVPESEFCRALSEFVNITRTCPIEPTYFETLIALAFWYFAKNEVDYAVIEVGIGGTLDATNVVRSKNKVSVITDIGYDHTELLGKTLDLIANNKAGIITEGNHVFIHPQGRSIMNVVRRHAQAKSAVLKIVPEALPSEAGQTVATAQLPLFQQRNFSLAWAATNYVAQRDDLAELTNEKLLAAAQTVVPGRMERITVNGQSLLLDGAHNPQKIKALASSIIKLHPNQKATALVSFNNHTGPQKLAKNLKELAAFADNIIITTYTIAQDQFRSGLDPEEVKKAADAIFKSVTIEPDLEEAVKLLGQSPSELKVATGSLFLVSEIKKL